MAISLIVAALAWTFRDLEHNGRVMPIGWFCRAVLLIDLAHTLSFPGMPPLASESTVQKAITFWLAACIAAAIGFLLLHNRCLAGETSLLSSLIDSVPGLIPFTDVGERLGVIEVSREATVRRTAEDRIHHLAERIRIDWLKIDRSFVPDPGGDADDEAIVTAVIQIAKSLRCVTLAEGVETHEQQEFLRSRGHDIAQDFQLHRPMPADDLAVLLRPAVPTVS
jgi:Membrane-associated sensor domain/EAL domain